MRYIELLAPAKNAETGIEAIRHGADAVYIGGPGFGARAAAGNTVEDIRHLCSYAHIFGAKVYVTLNTILYDDEVAEAEELVWQLYEAGVDALITQDLALLSMKLPPIALHASTQMDNCSPERAKFLEAAGYSQIVMARELSLEQIRAIHNSTSLPLEAFVHGALCVSYSGRCYASQYCFQRSANRGRCAQFCRLAFDLVDAEGTVLKKDKYLLSLRDMNRSNSLEEMMEAGVSSFKIEGRLKDVAYVKNVTAYYRAAIDAVIARKPSEYQRSSYGVSTTTFTPQLDKSFNRGFTEYFLKGRTDDVWNFSTPKSVGEYVGKVKRIGRRSFTYSPAKKEEASFKPAKKDEASNNPAKICAGTDKDHASANTNNEIHNGDGLVYINSFGKLDGFRANRVEGNEVFPLTMPSLSPGTRLYRNEDRVWEAAMQKPTAERTIGIQLLLEETTDGYELKASVHNRESETVEVACSRKTEIQAAQRPQHDNIVRNLSKLGGTPFAAENVQVLTQGERFIPASLLTEMRRELVERLTQALIDRHIANRDKRRVAEQGIKVAPEHTYTSNVANKVAHDYLLDHGARTIAPAFELKAPSKAVLMTCRHCLRYALGQCPKQTGHRPAWKEPVALQLPDGRKFNLRFDCVNCEMSVIANS